MTTGNHLLESFDVPYDLTRVKPKVTYVFDEWEFEVNSTTHVVRFTYAPYFGKRTVNVDFGVRQGTKVRRKVDSVPNIRKYLATVLKAIQNAQSDPTEKLENRRDGFVLLVPEKVYEKNGSRFVRLAKIATRKVMSVSDAISEPPEGEQSGMNTIFFWKRGKSFKQVFTGVAHLLDDDLIDVEHAETQVLSPDAPKTIASTPSFPDVPAAEPAAPVDASNPITDINDTQTDEFVDKISDIPQAVVSDNSDSDVNFELMTKVSEVRDMAKGIHNFPMVDELERVLELYPMTQEKLYAAIVVRENFMSPSGGNVKLSPHEKARYWSEEYWKSVYLDQDMKFQAKYRQSVYAWAQVFYGKLYSDSLKHRRVFSYNSGGDDDFVEKMLKPVLSSKAGSPAVEYSEAVDSFYDDDRIDRMAKFIKDNATKGDIDPQPAAPIRYLPSPIQASLSSGFENMYEAVQSKIFINALSNISVDDYEGKLSPAAKKATEILSQSYLSRDISPLRNMSKNEIRKLVKNLPESMLPDLLTPDYEKFKGKFWSKWAVSGSGFTQAMASAIIDACKIAGEKDFPYYTSLTMAENIEDSMIDFVVADPEENTSAVEHFKRNYEETQNFFRTNKKYAKIYKDGEGTVRLYRGIGIGVKPTDGYLPAGFESWSLLESTAKKFAKMMSRGKGVGTILYADVPLKYVLATYESLSGFFPPEDDLLGKKEFMVLGKAFVETPIYCTEFKEVYDLSSLSKYNVSESIEMSNGSQIIIKANPGGNVTGSSAMETYIRSKEFKDEQQTRAWILNVANEISNLKGKQKDFNGIPEYIFEAAVDLAKRRGAKIMFKRAFKVKAE